MTAQFKIRELRPADGRELIRNYFGYYAELRRNPGLGLLLFKKKPSLEDERKWFQSLRREEAKGTKVVSIAELDGKVVGMAEVSWDKGKELEHVGSFGIAIIEKARGNGIGEALTRDVIEKCRGKLEMIRLAVFTHNEPAKRLYRKIGFKKYGALKKAIKRGDKYFDEEFMYLKLKS
jgi:RimJ/RimL family protein N-acetyltransferase